MTFSNTEIPGYCCQSCGEPIGYVGRFFQWTRVMDFVHTCRRPQKAEAIVETVPEDEDEDESLLPLMPEEIAAEEEALEERELIAQWHEREAKRWQAELWDRRSWGGPTMGAEECETAIRFHKASAKAIRDGDYYATDSSST